MTRKLIVAAAAVAAIFTIVAPARAQVTVEMAEITCKQFADYDEDAKAFVSEWMRGYYSATKNLSLVDERYVKRNTEKVLKYCKKKPKSSLMDAIKKNAR
jgi:acid stress chaperone HdeB